MSKTSIILLLILAFAIGSFLIIIFLLPISLPKLTQTKQPQPIVNKTQITISFAETEQQAKAGQERVLALYITTPATLSDAQVEISYDPQVTIITSVSPGDYFLNPLELLKTINPANGRISYALTCSAPTGEACVNRQGKLLATIHYIPQIFLTQETTMSIMPKTSVQIDKETYPVTRGTAVTIHVIGSESINASPSAVIDPIKPIN